MSITKGRVCGWNRCISLVNQICQGRNGKDCKGMESSLVEVMVTEIPCKRLSKFEIGLARLLGPCRHFDSLI